MRAMILAAGRGERMRPLTDHCPKPLLQAGGRALIVWQIERLARAGLRDLVINHAHLGALIEAALGDGARWGVRIRYSPESRALETAGGIVQALPMLGSDPFLVVNADVWCDFDLGRAATIAQQMSCQRLLAWCVLVDNPVHHPGGDFGLRTGRLLDDAAQRFTFAGIGVYRPSLFEGVAAGTRASLAPLLRAACAAGRAGGEKHTGQWVDAGTPQRLAELDRRLHAVQTTRNTADATLC